MEYVSSKGLCRKRRHKSHGARSGRGDKSRKHPLKEWTEARKTVDDCYITQNRLTMRMGLFNKGKASDIILRTDGGGGGQGGGVESEGCRWQKPVLYEGQRGGGAETFSHQPKTKGNYVSKENRIVSSEAVGDDDHAAAAAAAAVNMSTSNLPNSPGIKKLSSFLTEHIDPKCIIPTSGYLQRARKCLQEQYKAALQKVEEEKENLDSHAVHTEQSHRRLTLQRSIHQTQQQQHSAAHLETTEDAAAAAVLWWSSSSAGANRSDIPPPPPASSSSSMPLPYHSLHQPTNKAAAQPTTTTGSSSPSASLGNHLKEFWSAAADAGSMRNHVNILSQPLLSITDAKSLLALNDFVYRAKQMSSCAAAAAVTSSDLRLLPSFVNDNPTASGPSSSEWTVDLDNGGCLKYIRQPSTSCSRNHSNVAYFNQQTDGGGGGGDILDIAETNQMSTDYMLQLLSDANNVNDDDDLATADGTEEHQMELVGGLLSLKNSQGCMDETISSWEMQLPKLLVPTVHSPSPQQKYYRRKVF